MAVSFEVRGISGLIANVHNANTVIGANVRAAMRRNGLEQQAETIQAAPKRTGFLAAHTRLEFSPEGLTYAVGYDEKDFSAAGLYPYFYPVLLGSSTQEANNYLFAVHEQHSSKLTRDVGQAIRDGLRAVTV